MFKSGHWAAALIKSIEREGGKTEDGIEFLKVLTSWVKKLPGETAGSSAAKKMETLIREGITKKSEALSPEQETALCIFLLMVQKKAIRHIDSVIEKAKELQNKNNNVITVSVEYALPAGDNAAKLATAKLATESRIKEEIKKRSSAARVELTEHFNPALIGGYRLRIGDEIIDASVRSQLKRMEACLVAGPVALPK